MERMGLVYESGVNPEHTHPFDLQDACYTWNSVGGNSYGINVFHETVRAYSCVFIICPLLFLDANLLNIFVMQPTILFVYIISEAVGSLLYSNDKAICNVIS